MSAKNFMAYGDAETIMSGIADRIDKVTFIGTTAEWNALNSSVKEQYDLVCITDDGGTGLTVTNVVENGNMNPVTSNAVYLALLNKIDYSDFAPAFSDSTNYAVGDYVTYNSKLYRCIATHNASAWDANDFIIVTINSELKSRQDKTLSSAITIDGVSATTVESALNTINTKKINASARGTSNGIAELDANGKVPSSQLPSYVDDVIEGYYKTADGKFYKESTYTTEIIGETGKIYVSVDTDITYRWSGSAFVAIGSDLALGETSSTAYAGNKGKANADAITAIKNGQSIDSFGDVETALSDKVSKSNTAGLLKNDGTVDTNTYAKTSALSDYVAKSQTSGLLKNDGTVDTTTYAQASTLSDYIEKSQTAGLVKNDGTIDTTQYISQHQDISDKANKVVNATNGHLAGLNASGDLTDSGVVGADVVTKVTGGTTDNLVKLDANGKIADAGKKVSDLAEKDDVASIITTGATNSTGSTITAGTYFYLNGSLVKAKADIANGVSYTLNTNYEAVTIGNQLTALNSKLMQYINILDPNAIYVSGSHVYSIDIGGFLAVQGYCSITAEVPTNTILFTLSSAISKKFITGVHQYLSVMSTNGTPYMLGTTPDSNMISVANNSIPAGTYSFFGILAVKS